MIECRRSQIHLLSGSAWCQLASPYLPGWNGVDVMELLWHQPRSRLYFVSFPPLLVPGIRPGSTVAGTVSRWQSVTWCSMSPLIPSHSYQTYLPQTQVRYIPLWKFERLNIVKSSLSSLALYQLQCPFPFLLLFHISSFFTLLTYGLWFKSDPTVGSGAFAPFLAAVFCKHLLSWPGLFVPTLVFLPVLSESWILPALPT